jgi:hypothetical protein
VTFTPTDATNYTEASGSNSITVNKATLIVKANDYKKYMVVCHIVVEME